MVQLPRVIVTTSWDDGHPLDGKLAALLAELGINGTFYVATQNRERPVMGSRALRELATQFEIGAHTRTHRRLPDLSDKCLKEELALGRMDLEDVLSRPVGMFCYPGGEYDRRVRKAVEKAGFAGARTTQDFWLEVGNDAWRMPTTLQAFPHGRWVRLRHGLKYGNWRGLGRMLQMGPDRSWNDLGGLLFDRVLAKGGVWHLWGHSWEIEEYGLWNDLRTLLGRVAGRDGVHYLTNGEVMETCRSQGSNRILGAGVAEGHSGS